MADAPLKITPSLDEDRPADRPALHEMRPRRPRKRRWLWFPALLIVAVAGYGWSQYRAGNTAEPVVTETPVRGAIENSVTAAGLLRPIRDVDVGAQVSGQLKSVKVAIGDAVTEGQLIAEIDSASIETQIEIAEAEIADLQAQMVDKKAQVVLSGANLTRQRNLVARNTASQAALDEAVAALATAEANVAALDAQLRKQQAMLKDARISLGHTKIYAPLAGTIVNIVAKEGQTLNANQSTPTIVTIADLSTMTVEAEVSEADISRLALGMETYFTLLGQPGKRYPGRLRQIKPTPSTENNVVLYYALFDVPNPNGALMMNMTAQVFFVQDAANDVLTVPVSAVRFNDGDGEVTVVTASGTRETRAVKTGIRNRVRVEITQGVSESDAVVVGIGTAAEKPASSSASRSRWRRGMGGMPHMF